MQHAQSIHVGDRVRACCSLANLPEGSTGIVQRIFHTVGLYDVLFEAQRVQYILHRHDLVLVPRERVRQVAG